MSPVHFQPGQIYHTITPQGYVDAYVVNTNTRVCLFTRFGWYVIDFASRRIEKTPENIGCGPHLSFDNWLEGPTPIHAVARELTQNDLDQFNLFI